MGTNDKEFVDLFAEALTEAGVREHWSPVQLVGGWEELVTTIEQGYDDNIYEYHNDLTVRDFVERVLGNPKLHDVPQMGWVRERIAAADARLRSVLIDTPVRDDPAIPWWRSHIPRLAGKELADDFRDNYGVSVEVR